jgi:GTP-binding protein
MAHHASGEAETRVTPAAPSSAPAHPSEPSEEALEAGRKLFAAEGRFFFGAENADAMPEARLPEIAFAGRSNVGKSTLLNALTGRNSLARTSRTPGRTRQLNFFDLGGRLVLVDLPGYGYAAAPKKEIAAWNALIRAYLRGRPNLQRLCLLIDARHGVKPADREIMELLDEAAVVFQIVLTKADKAGPEALAATRAAVEAELARHPAGHPEAIATSAVTGEGVPLLRAALAGLAAPPPRR